MPAAPECTVSLGQLLAVKAQASAAFRKSVCELEEGSDFFTELADSPSSVPSAC